MAVQNGCTGRTFTIFTELLDLLVSGLQYLNMSMTIINVLLNKCAHSDSVKYLL